MDSDLAEYFGTTTGNLNRARKRNIKRFPDKFCFQLTKTDYYKILRCQTGILESEQGKYSKCFGVTLMKDVGPDLMNEQREAERRHKNKNKTLKKNKILKFLFKKDEVNWNINLKIKAKSC